MSGGYEDDYDDHLEPEGAEDRSRSGPTTSSGRTTAPAVVLIITGVINLLLGGYFILDAMVVQNMSVEELEKALESRWSEEQHKQMLDAGYTPQKMKDLVVQVLYPWGGLSLLGAILTIIGGSCMAARKARGMAIGAAFVNIVPLVMSPCCLLGCPIGIWALVVLLNPEVKQAFR